MDLAKLVDSNREAMVKTLQEAVRIKSVQEPAVPGKPFGEGPARCLAYMLEEAEKLGLLTFAPAEKTENDSGYTDDPEHADEMTEEDQSING